MTKYFQKQKNKKPFKWVLQKKMTFHVRLEIFFNIFDDMWGGASKSRHPRAYEAL